MSNVLIKNCNNIKEASIVIEEGNLNIKFAINGTGKSTIAKALLNKDKDLSLLKPFGKEENPGVECNPNIDNVELFDSDFVNNVVFNGSNVIENAFEACALCGDIKKKVEVSLYEDDLVIEMQVRDNGKSIDNKIRDIMFTEGISSKGEDRGTGLYLVKNRVEIYNGSIDIEEFDDEKIFVVTILKGGI